MGKKEDLKRLDEEVLKKMIQAIENDEPEKLPLYSTAIQYLKANEITEERERDTAEDEVKKKVKEANDRRKTKV